jgi:hypothetical protein
MKRQGHRILLCDCERSMAPDGEALCRVLAGGGDARVHTQLCRAEIDAFRGALRAGDEGLIVACTQEAPLFAETAAEIAPEAALRFVNIRENAGWSAEGAEAGPKIAALLAAAAEPVARRPLSHCARKEAASSMGATRPPSRRRGRSAAGWT